MIVFTYTALNGLDIMASDIQNAYIQDLISEKCWTILGPEFGPELQGCNAYIMCAIYVTRCAEHDFRQHLRECMELLGYTSCLADLDLWISKCFNEYGCEYYEYILLYVDNCLCVSGRLMEALEEVKKYFLMNDLSIDPPNIYL